MILQDVGMLAVSSNRTKFYLQQMARFRLLPAYVVLMEVNTLQTPEMVAAQRSRAARKRTQNFHSLNMGISVAQLLVMHGIPHSRIPTVDPNSQAVIDAVKDCSPSIIIYSGPGGAILRPPILETGKRFLHVHPGYLPDYRGSTTLYYSLLKEGNFGATALFLDHQIDTGAIIRRMKYPAPEDREGIDLYFDPYIRSQLLVEVLKEYAEKGTLEVQAQDAGIGDTYFIIHPVLKHIAILGR
jgi:methionyl-tRNA formyltransferase